MKRLFTLLVLAAVMLTPILVRAEEQLPVSARSAATASHQGASDSARPKGRESDPARLKLWRLAPDGPRMSVGAAELKLDVAPQRWGITMSLAL